MSTGGAADGTSAAAGPGDQHPVTIYFAQRFRELAAAADARTLTCGEAGKINPHVLYRLLSERAPHLALSERQVYRYFNGAATPRIDLVFELAQLFGVSPCYFLPGDPLGKTRRRPPLTES